jgi:predicted nucleic acid-binding protein
LKLFAAVDRGDFSFITSTITLLEVLVKPLQESRQDVVTKYTEILTTAKGIDIFDINIAVSKEAAKLRAKYRLRTPDAIQLGTAIIFGADMFLTNDTILKSVSEIKVVTLSEIT